MKKVKVEDGQSTNIVAENIEHLKELFPEVFTEDGINFDTFRQLLGDAKVLDEGEEKYGLNWHGKKQARQIALSPSVGTLLPCPDESIDWDTTKNLFIEGDNLEVLKLLQKSYANKVKMIYIDPPYNTGKEFIYPDKFKENLDTYLKYTGQVDHKGIKFSSNTESTGRKHTNWLNMMYPRLKLSKNLLKNDGLIFISIDDNEYSNLKEICNEIFGEENFLANLIWKSGGTSSSHYTSENEYILVYGKNISILPFFNYEGDAIISDRAIKSPGIKNPLSEITFPAGIDFESEDKVLPTKFGNAEPVEVVAGVMECKDGKLLNEVTLCAAWTMKDQIIKWLNKEDVIDQKGQQVKRFFFKSNGVLQYEKQKGTQHPKTTINNVTTKAGSSELKEMFGEVIFDFPKPVELIKELARPVLSGSKSDIILDFFSGSATTAQCVLELNNELQKKHKFICVQLPEVVDSNTTMFKAGYKTISKAAIERIRRVLGKLRCGSGVKVFKLSNSNIKEWNPDRTDLEESLLSHQEHLIEGRTEQDVLYELLLKRGVDLSVPIESREVFGKNIYSIGYGVLFACLDESITSEQVESIAQCIIAWYAELSPSSDTHVFFRDSAFRDDISKTNMAAILEQNGITHIRSL